MGSQINTKSLRETRAEIERLGGVFIGVERTGKHIKVRFEINGTEQSEFISKGSKHRYDAPHLRRKFRQKFARDGKNEA